MPKQPQQLFRFEVFCTSQQLGTALWLLTNKVVEVGSPQVVVNAKTNGKGRITAATGGTLLEMFAEHLRKWKPEKFQVGDVKAWMESTGVASTRSATYLMKNAVEHKLVRKVGQAKKGTGKPILYAPNASALTAATAKE